MIKCVKGYPFTKNVVNKAIDGPINKVPSAPLWRFDLGIWRTLDPLFLKYPRKSLEARLAHEGRIHLQEKAFTVLSLAAVDCDGMRLADFRMDLVHLFSSSTSP